MDAVVGEAALPYFAGKSQLAPEAEGVPALDELHCLLEAHVAGQGEQEMQVIGHDHEIVEAEAAGGDAGAQNVDEQGCVAVGLQESLPHEGFGGDEEGAAGVEDSPGVSIAGRNGHGRHFGG